MKKLALITLFTATLLSPTLSADIIESQTSSLASPDTVVELFTSQGCSSCPPANRFAASLTDDPTKLVLTYGVTYWDYLGWKDTFGDPKFTQRQRQYGKALELANVYTPQIILNGSAHSPRYKLSDVNSFPLKSTRPKASLSKTDTDLIFEMPLKSNPENYRVVIVSYTPGSQDVDISRGENGGRTLSLANVVTDVTPVKSKNLARVNTNIVPQDGQSYAALVHDVKTAQIVTAAVYKP